eukprot:12405800-Karenia_brevis.AAC.1
MHDQGKLLQQLGSKSPYVGSKANQARGLSHSGKGPAAGIGQPDVICQHQLENKCPGLATLEAIALNPYCACGCGALLLISRKI